MTALVQQLQDSMPELRGRLQGDADLSKLTWFRVGGPAEVLFQPADENDLGYFLQELPVDVPVLVIGVGSNLLIRDGGVSGVVIRLSAKGFGQIEQVTETRLRAGCAVLDKKLASAALEAGIGGFAFFHGIPGGIGGALRMNAGANGTETTHRVVEVTAFDRKGKRHVLSHNDLGYSYRHSAAPDDLIFTSALFEGNPESPETIRHEMDAVQHHRETVQPIREKTGGSTFKNPEGHSAWRLVDAAGMRGYRVGGAQMSEMHCNFMINRGDATAFDLEMLGETVRQKVLENSGIRLDWEIKRLGHFSQGKSVPGAG